MNQENEKTPTATHKLYEADLHRIDKAPTFAIGYAGTGKTYTAVKAALKMDVAIIVIRPNVPYGEELGFLPGGEAEKLLPWTMPVRECLLKLDVSPMKQQQMEGSGQLRFIPLGYTQGLQFDNCVAIVDEVQNMKYKAILGLSQRVGINCKMVFCGDVRQVAIGFKDSGLAEFIEMIRVMKLGFKVINFGEDDILRSDICKRTTIAAEGFENLKKAQAQFEEKWEIGK
jgi:phosphate starvation-inducible protein PhoH